MSYINEEQTGHGGSGVGEGIRSWPCAGGSCAANFSLWSWHWAPQGFVPRGSGPAMLAILYLAGVSELRHCTLRRSSPPQPHPTPELLLLGMLSSLTLRHGTPLLECHPGK